MFLITGLGNPGIKYSGTRHNIGWMVLDELARRHEISISRKLCEAQVGSGLIGQNRVLLAKPQTFMNLSGRAVASLLNFHRIERSHLMIVCDDLNLPLGKLRVRPSGSDGGHNGLKSVEQYLSSREYFRLRFGVGEPPGQERMERGTTDYVLKPFPADESDLVEETIGRAADCIEEFVHNGVTAAMNRYNG